VRTAVSSFGGLASVGSSFKKPKVWSIEEEGGTAAEVKQIEADEKEEESRAAERGVACLETLLRLHEATGLLSVETARAIALLTLSRCLTLQHAACQFVGEVHSRGGFVAAAGALGGGAADGQRMGFSLDLFVGLRLARQYCERVQATAEELACLLADSSMKTTMEQRRRNKLLDRVLADLRKHYKLECSKRAFAAAAAVPPAAADGDRRILNTLEFFPRVALRVHAHGLWRKVHRRHVRMAQAKETARQMADWAL